MCTAQHRRGSDCLPAAREAIGKRGKTSRDRSRVTAAWEMAMRIAGSGRPQRRNGLSGWNGKLAGRSRPRWPAYSDIQNLCLTCSRFLDTVHPRQRRGAGGGRTGIATGIRKGLTLRIFQGTPLFEPRGAPRGWRGSFVSDSSSFNRHRRRGRPSIRSGASLQSASAFSQPIGIVTKTSERGISKRFPEISKGFQRFPKVSKGFQKFHRSRTRATRRDGGSIDHGRSRTISNSCPARH